MLNGSLRFSLVSLSLLGAGLLNSAWAADRAPNSRISDVVLSAGGRLDGQVVDYKGNALPNVPVALKSEGIEPIATTTTGDGRFAYEGLPGGVYQVAAKNGDSATVRVWTPQAAPPNAQAQAVLYTQNVADPVTPAPNAPTVSGGKAPPRGVFKTILAHPFILSGAIATAIAVPVALNSNHKKPASP